MNVKDSVFQANTRGILVLGGAVNIQDSTIVNNTGAARAENQGPDQDSSIRGTTPRFTVVRISGGMISSNTSAFEMHNPGAAGTRPPGDCNAQNIFLRNDTNIVGNPTFLTVTGTPDSNAGCTGSVTIGSYTPRLRIS